METELRGIKSNPAPPTPETPAQDDLPLLKSDSNGSLQTESSLEDLEKKYAPFVPRDLYGPKGRGKLPLAEKLLLGIALVTAVPIRVAFATALLLVYYVVCRVCTMFSAPNKEEGSEKEWQEDFAHLPAWRREVIVWCGRFLSRVMLFVFGFYWIKETYRALDAQNDGKGQSEEPERPGATISNHVSYLDILYHMSSSFPSFVAKISVARLPLVGLISKCLGWAFVQQESKTLDFKGVSGIVTERVKEAHENRSAPMMILFPGVPCDISSVSIH